MLLTITTSGEVKRKLKLEVAVITSCWRCCSGDGYKEFGTGSVARDC